MSFCVLCGEIHVRHTTFNDKIIFDNCYRNLKFKFTSKVSTTFKKAKRFILAKHVKIGFQFEEKSTYRNLLVL